MRNYRFTFIVFQILLLHILPLHAQDPTLDAQKAHKRFASFIFTDWPEGVENPIKVKSGSEIIEVLLSKRMASMPVKIPADGVLQVVREAIDPADSAKKIYQILAQAQVPEDNMNTMCVLIPLAKPKGSLLFNTKVQNLAKFQGGDWLFMNFTNVEIGVTFGEKNLSIQPGQHAIGSSPNLKHAIQKTIAYHYKLPEKEEWELISASTTVVMPSRREICIFSFDEKFGQIAYHGVTFPVE